MEYLAEVRSHLPVFEEFREGGEGGSEMADLLPDSLHVFPMLLVGFVVFGFALEIIAEDLPEVLQNVPSWDFGTARILFIILLFTLSFCSAFSSVRVLKLVPLVVEGIDMELLSYS